MSAKPSETPETDLAQFAAIPTMGRGSRFVVEVDVARSLERQRDEARADALNIRDAYRERAERAEAALAKARDDALADVEARLLAMVKLQTASAWPHVQGVSMALNMVRNLKSGTK